LGRCLCPSQHLRSICCPRCSQHPVTYKARNHLHLRHPREGQLVMSLCMAPRKFMLTFKQMKSVRFSFQCSCSMCVIIYLVWNGIYMQKNYGGHKLNPEHRRSNCPASSEIAAPVCSAQPSSSAHTNPGSRGGKHSSIMFTGKHSSIRVHIFVLKTNCATQHTLPAPLRSRLASGSAATSTSTGRGKGQLF
jgi:hypothetical protein